LSSSSFVVVIVVVVVVVVVVVLVVGYLVAPILHSRVKKENLLVSQVLATKK
jgi:ABC-type sugar transport system permease subunit